MPTSTPVDALATRRVYGPYLALAAAVLVAFTAYALLGHAAPAPRVFPDELIYLDAASSLAEGDGLEVREAPYSYAVLYPIVLAPFFAGFDRETAYELVKLFNALLFALAALPVYLLARRLLAPWPSVAVAALSVAVPSAMYTSVVMTESLAYLMSCSALLAILRAVERPTVTRQCAALAVIAVAYLVRPQFFALYVAYVLALIGAPLLVRARWSEVRKLPAELWPTIVAGVLALAALVARPYLTGAAPSESLGAYSVLWRAYSPFGVGRYLVYELANLELYLGVLPIVLAPLVVSALVVSAREGRREHAAFVAVFVSVNACLLALVAAFDSYHVLYLHDRYLFYVVPLWLVVLFAWVATGARRPRAALAIGVGLALLVAFAPLTELQAFRGHWRFHALGSAFPAEVADAVGSISVARVVLVVLSLAVFGIVLLVRRSALAFVVAVLVWIFAVNGAGAWATAFDPPQRSVFAGSEHDRGWVDRRVPASATVTQLYVSCEGLVPSDRWQATTNGLLLTEFFNASIGPLFHLGGDRSTTMRVSVDGSLSLGGEALRASYVVAQPGARVLGERLGEGTAARLALWRVDGPVRVAGVGSSAELRDVVCRAER